MQRMPTPDIMRDVLVAKTGPELIPLAKIRVDGGTQMRAGLNEDTVKEYAEKFLSHHAWGDFPPVVLYYDGTDYWVGDGFHRIAAYQRACPGDPATNTVHADVRAGDRRDAVLFAAGANANHGLRRTQADKRRSVETLLRDADWQKWSDREIARICHVSADLVGDVRKVLAPTVTVGNDSERTYTNRHGGTSTMNTANIGTSRPVATAKAELWQLEWAASQAIREFYRDENEMRTAWSDMRASARSMNGGFWLAAMKVCDNHRFAFERADLAKAIVSVADQRERQERASEAARQAKSVASNPSVTAHTWEGYDEWNADDDAEYAALAPIWQQPAGSFNSLSEYERITRWRVAARLASERRDNLSGSLQESARRLRLAERFVAAEAARPAEAAAQAAVQVADAVFGITAVDEVDYPEWTDGEAARQATAVPTYGDGNIVVPYLAQEWQEATKERTPSPGDIDAVLRPDAVPVIRLDALEVVATVTAPAGEKRIQPAQELLRLYTEVINRSDEYGELTGRFSDMLPVERGLAIAMDHLIDLLRILGQEA